MWRKLVIKVAIATLLTFTSFYPITFVSIREVREEIYFYDLTPTQLLLGVEDEVEVHQELEVCHYGTNKTYMDYRSLNINSNQYKLLSTLATKDGFFYDQDGYMAVALGSYFGELGSRYEFELDTGIVLKVIKVDEKADRHTFDGCQQRWDKSVVEFIIDSEKIKYWWGEKYVLNGNFNNHDDFKGDIVRIIQK